MVIGVPHMVESLLEHIIQLGCPYMCWSGTLAGMNGRCHTYFSVEVTCTLDHGVLDIHWVGPLGTRMVGVHIYSYFLLPSWDRGLYSEIAVS